MEIINLSNIMPEKTKITSDRTALLIYCTREEADCIKRVAKRERRTITGFVMNAVMSRLGAMQAVKGRLEGQGLPGNLGKHTE